MIFGKYLNKYYKKYWYLFLYIIVADTIVDLVQLLVPRIIGEVVNKLTPDKVTNQISFIMYPTADIAFYETDFFKLLISILIITIIIVLGRMSWRYASAHIGAYIERDLRKEMFEHVQTLSLTYFKNKKVGGLLSYFTNDLQTIKMVFSDGLIFLVDLLVLGTTAFIYMFLMSWQITLISAIPLLFFIVFGAIVGRSESRKFKISSDAFENLSDYTEESLQGFQVIKAFIKEKEKNYHFRQLSLKAKDTSIDYLRYSSFIDLGINTFITIFFGLMISMAAFSIINTGFFPTDNIKQSGDLITYAGYYDSLIWPMFAGGMLIDYISRGNGAYKRISEIFDVQEDVKDNPNAIHREKLIGKVQFKNLSFKYPDGSITALANIDFTVEPGQTIGIIGRTGEGKSTLVNLMLKLYNIADGSLFIDDIDINDWRKEDLRKHIGVVSQNAFLFSGPLKQSISFSEDEPEQCDMNRVKEAAKFACIDKDIEDFAKGYDTFVKEKGASLSGGQRQRISIARAIYKNPSILILDDSLSAVDADTEKRILKNIKSFRNKLTTFIIAHRVSAIEDADLILVIDHGAIIAQGKHSELLHSCELYKHIVRLQELEREVNNV